ncbi:uncharacterized protein BCR38DRAFT_412137, partial [Pseudomassariella vexata]
TVQKFISGASKELSRTTQPWEVEYPIEVPATIQPLLKGWTEDPRSFFSGGLLTDDISSLYQYLRSLDSKQATAVYTFRRRVALATFAWLKEATRCNSLADHIVQAGNVDEVGDEVVKKCTIWAKKGKRYRGYVDDFGGNNGVLFALDPDISSTFREQDLHVKGEKRKAFLDKLRRRGVVQVAESYEGDASNISLWNDTLVPTTPSNFVEQSHDGSDRSAPAPTAIHACARREHHTSLDHETTVLWTSHGPDHDLHGGLSHVEDGQDTELIGHANNSEGCYSNGLAICHGQHTLQSVQGRHGSDVRIPLNEPDDYEQGYDDAPNNGDSELATVCSSEDSRRGLDLLPNGTTCGLSESGIIREDTAVGVPKEAEKSIFNNHDTGIANRDQELLKRKSNTADSLSGPPKVVPRSSLGGESDRMILDGHVSMRLLQGSTEPSTNVPYIPNSIECFTREQESFPTSADGQDGQWMNLLDFSYFEFKTPSILLKDYIAETSQLKVDDLPYGRHKIQGGAYMVDPFPTILEKLVRQGRREISSEKLKFDSMLIYLDTGSVWAEANATFSFAIPTLID